MNIFILDEDPILSVRYHPDKHIVKMPTEATQLLCTALHYAGCAPHWVYRPTHFNHPCAVWVRESLQNWLWLQDYVRLMGEEYSYRYGRTHRAVAMAAILPTPNLPELALTPFAKCVPEEFRHLQVVEAYRRYFVWYKQHLKKYTGRSVPIWWV